MYLLKIFNFVQTHSCYDCCVCIENAKCNVLMKVIWKKKEYKNLKTNAKLAEVQADF